MSSDLKGVGFALVIAAPSGAGKTTLARALVDRFLDRATEADFRERLTFPTLTAGMLTASKHKILANFVNHGIRHWAQAATALRQHGYGDQWPHDLLASDVLD